MKTSPLSASRAIAIVLSMGSLVSLAQTPGTVPNPPAVKPAEKKDGTISIDAVEVTGSRIRGLLGEADFSPVISFSRQEIEQTGLTNMGEISRLIPQAFSQGSYDGIGFGGQAQGQSTVSDGSTASVLTQRTNVNLRGLGAASTLILVNGRRLARSGNIRGSDGYDLTGLPVASIERVEILTDGASAIYGSDALAGVINIILRKNYSGTEVAASYENTFDSDTAVSDLALTHGITRGPLSLIISATYQKRNAFAAVDRPYSATDDWRTLGGTSTFASYGVGGFATGAGVVQAVTGNLPGLSSPSQYAVIPTGATGATTLPASAYAPTTVSAETGDRAKYVNLISPQFTRTIGFRASYDLRPNLQLYLNGGYNESRTHIEGMPVNYRNSILVPANYPGNPFGVQVRLNKTFWELPQNLQGEKFTTNSNLNLNTGVAGKYWADWRYDLSLNWNRSGLRNENAFDPVLNTAVSDPLIAAQRLVLFYDSRTSQPNDLNTLRSMLRPGNASDRTDVAVWSATTDGALPWFELPAGPIRVAAGAERTTESIKTSQSIPDAPTINLSLLGSFERTLDAGYAETRIPVVAPTHQLPLLHRLDLTAAIRYDYYSDAGGDYSPRYGAQLRPVKWLLFRATRNHSFRAPGIQVLYRSVTDSTNANTAGFFDRQRNELVAGVIATRIGGNLGLQPERAISDNLGVVFEFPFAVLKGLSISFDAGKLNYQDQITTLSTLQEWADLFPERLIRDTAGAQPGRVIGIDTRATNISRLEVETFDYQINYQRATRSLGNFIARLSATEYRSWNAYRLPTSAPVNSLNLRPTRVTWQTYWNKGPYGAGVSGFYQENSWLAPSPTANPPILPFSRTLFASVIEWNIQASYDFGWRAAQSLAALGSNPRPWRQRLFEGTKLAVTVNNVFDREPPHRQGNAGFGVTDPRQARYSLTLRKQL